MPKFKFTQTHSLGHDEAKNRLSKLVDKMKEDFKNLISNAEEHWEDNTAFFSFKIYGATVKGKVEVTKENADLEIEYPLTMAPFKSMVEKEIRKKAEELLS